jgi:hypothetical protein
VIRFVIVGKERIFPFLMNDITYTEEWGSTWYKMGIGDFRTAIYMHACHTLPPILGCETYVVLTFHSNPNTTICAPGMGLSSIQITHKLEVKL